MAGAPTATQPLLPGLESWLEVNSRPARRRMRSPAGGKPPSVDKIASKAPAAARERFASLRAALLGETGVRESVAYDESAAAFLPAYAVGRRELVRFHLDPVVAATLTLEPGESQLARLLASPALPDRLKAQAVRSARRSGKRIFLAFLARTVRDVADLVRLLRERAGMER